MHKTIKNNVIKQAFTSNLTTLAIYYTEDITEYIKDCSDYSFFKCWADRIKETKSHNCANRCVPLTLDSVMDMINHTIPKCNEPIEKDEYCMFGWNGYV